MKKAQIVSFDFATSVMIFTVFIIIFIGLLIFSQKDEQKAEFELEYVFANLENNLVHKEAPNSNFLSNYRVDLGKLNRFASSYNGKEVDSLVIGNVEKTHGIGLDSDAYDSCIFFIDNDNKMLELTTGSGVVALGYLDKVGKSCNQEIVAGRNPCEKYRQSITYFKPVLLDAGHKYNNRIIQMDIVVCKR